MLPHLKNRPLTLFVYPKGIGGPRSVQMHWQVKPPPFMKTVQIYSTNQKHDHTYLMCNNTPSLLWLANAGVLEFHTWHSRLDPAPDAPDIPANAAGSLKNLERSLLNYPDYIFFDIDSYVYSGKEKEGAEPEYHPEGFQRCTTAALKLRDLLSAMRLKSLVKTSGKTGLHIVVPIVRSIDFNQAREIGRQLYTRLVKEAPDDFTMEWRVSDRNGKTFLDWGMNRRATSMAAPYTIRAVPGAFVSMPIAWDELQRVEPPDFRIDTVVARLKKRGDKWRDLLALKQPLVRKRTVTSDA
jgi:bifunctional non-homologous end joining protein LigD